MQDNKKTPLEKRLSRLEDSFLTLVQLNRIFSEEADTLRSRLAHLESLHSGRPCPQHPTPETVLEGA